MTQAVKFLIRKASKIFYLNSDIQRMKIERPKSTSPIPDHAKRVFKGVIFDVYQWEQEMFDSTKAVFEKLKRADTVIVFPVLPDGKIILTEEEQPGKAMYLGAPGGRVDEGEDILVAIKRELLEETGYEAEEYILWDAEYPIGKIDWVIYTFVAKGLKKVSEPHLDAGERITIKTVTFDELLDLALHPKFSEKGIIPKLLEAKSNPEKMDELKKLFDPKF